MKKYVLKTALKNVRRTPYQSLAALLVMAMAFFITSAFILVGAGFDSVLHYFETRPQVTAFFKQELSGADIDKLKIKLEQIATLREVKYVSKEEALKIYREQNKADPLLLEMVTANILPPSLEISANDVSSLSKLADALKSDPAVEEIVFQQDVIETLENWANIFRKGGIILAGCFLMVAFLITGTVIGMKVSMKRKEVGILSLVGASFLEIRLPFIFEGFAYGIIGAVVGWGLAYLLLLYASPILISFFADFSMFPVPIVFMLEVLLVESLLGALVGVLGSWLAIRKYLK